VEVRGGRLARIEGWRFGPNDAVDPGAGSWRAQSAQSLVPPRPVWPGAACVLDDDSLQSWNRRPLAAVGVLVYLEGTPTLRVETPRGNFELATGDLKLGRTQELLDGHVRAELATAGERVDLQAPEQDFPSLAAGPDGSLWLAYQSYTAARHEDRILLTHLENGRWSAPEDVAGPGNFYKPQVAVDGQNRLWVVWAAFVDEDWELFARRREAGRWSEGQRLTSTRGGDLNQRLARAPDGTLWLAWQSGGKGNWDILVSKLEGTRWSAPEAVTADPENEWEPALAAGSDGRVAIAYDRLRRGSHNVYLRIRSPKGWEPETPVASGEDYEAHASVAIDSKNRVWVAWDNGGPRWGLDSACNGLFRQRHMAVRVYTEGGWESPQVNPMRDLPLAMQRFVSQPQVAIDAQNRVWLLFRHWTNRQVYEFFATYLGAGGWSDPIPIPHSTGREHQSIAWARTPEGRLWTAWATDGSEPRRIEEKHYAVLAAALPGAVAGGPDFSLMRATPAAETTVTLPREPARYGITLGDKNLRVYWGDMHRHTDISAHRFTDGSLEDTYRYGTDVARLDFLAPTDHVDQGAPTAEYIKGDDYHWWRIQKAADLFHLPQAFLPIYAYERSMQSPGGHRNVLHLKRGGVPVRGNIKDPQDNLPTTLWDRLRGQEVLVFPHTPGDVMQPLITWDYRNPDFEPLMEIYQGLRSSYEYRGAPLDGKLGNTQTDEPGHFYQDALAKGRRYGVQASSDHLATHINYTGVYAEELSRPALFRAMKARHTFAASDKIIVDFRMGDRLMGDELRASSPPPMQVKVIGTGRIRSVEVIRNGQVLYAVTADGERAGFQYRDSRPPAGEAYYYIRVIQSDGNMAWSSPIWVTVQP
jgi:hypothetical protein